MYYYWAVCSGKPVENIDLTLMSNGGRFDIATTDSEGRFHFPVGDFSTTDSTWLSGQLRLCLD